ncbi:sec23-binding domain of sec16 domain-containing protein [Trichoderma breve]|uniref:Protein transport protein SEC31 n=1 Tax=Trichoderma breve TaxID=2034170 RepID=A0A9W9BAT7_9HYPO|nr:sec23-binding domain of sec16 domain-containing protein [Trichoderma breve]KAJ4859067.1 sec23-binding domain of sec16 domain-containing protein [Trichoderma breve]
MVRLRDIPRTATFAWSPGSGKPLVVTGTKAGAVDADFSDESKLEIWDLSLDNQEQGIELQPVVSITTDSRFYDIAWGPADADHPKGIIAGALENGTLELWDAEKLETGASDASISKTTKHTGAIKAIQFSPLKPQLLATAGAKGELFIYDIGDIENPFRLGNAAARSDDIDCLAWNRKVSHILATGGPGGFVTVWDLKTKKASLTLNNNRKAVSAIAWDPTNSTKLLTATADDNTPVIFLWNLRNSNAPEKTLQGHEQGVLSLSWCQQDPDLLLSSGKDNKTIVWNPNTAERYGELPEVTNWTFQTRFHPHNPNLSATASFDGKITIQTLQNTNPDKSQAVNEKPLDDEEFFRAAQTQPQGASWSLAKAPKWFERPIGASFGFGGKLVIFRASTQPGQERSSKLAISQFSADSDVSSAIEKFQEALNSNDVATLCQEKKDEAHTDEEKADWTVIETLVGENPRSKIVEHLGFKQEDLTNGASTDAPEGQETEAATKEEESVDAEGKSRRLSNMFGEGEGDGDDFLSGLTANKGAKTDKPFHLFSDGDTSVEKDITRALMLGNFAKATDICLKENRIADAFLIANCGGQELVEKVQSTYLSRKSDTPSYLRLISSVVEKNLWDIVYNADLENWKETMAIVCTFSDPTEFPDLCEALGDRINEQGQRKDASFCYLVGSKLEKVVAIWVDELNESEQAGVKEESGGSTFSVHTRSLQSFIEKVTVFRHVAKFQDKELAQTADWKLATLYDKYTEYAEILSGQGKLEVAQKYLDLLPATYPAAELTRSRVKLATQKKPAAAPVSAARRTPSIPSAGKQPSVVGYQPPHPAPIQAPYKPPVNPYQPQGYQPQGYQPQGYQPQNQFGFTGAPIAPPPISGPPRNTTPSAGPPPSKAKNMENWNDVPMVTKAAPRRSTPSVTPIASPFGAQQGQGLPPPPPSTTSPYGPGARASPPPPPKGPAPPRVQSPLAGPPVTGPPRTSSAAANQYAPPTPLAGAIPTHAAPPVMPRTASPYNAPPAGPPVSNRPPPPANPYAPPAQQQPAAPSPYAPSPYAPAPGQQTAPPPAAKYPPGDRSHIPAHAQALVDILSQDMQRVASKAPPTFAPQVKDTQKRLNILFDHLNNEELVQPSTIEQLSQLAVAIQTKDYATAQRLQMEINRDKTEECGNWMVGVKRLISMSKATP